MSLGKVEEFVRVGHSDLDAVRSLLEEQPKLVNAAWDWGGGDWETALGGAAHMGRPDIAVHLLEHGARIDVFAAAMLGKLAIVKAAVDAYSDTRHVLGPHGIPLMKHAKKGGDAAKPVVEYLESLEK
ncbi:MAG: ankyrin repeat domain-containing protein [Planctomycetes bacterium]|nr:ankyrin repeat domain-containing protein [Planctomycetota bacterium]